MLLVLLSYGLLSSTELDGSPKILWFIESNPSSRDDLAFASCIVKDYVVIVGKSGRVEYRFKSNGSLAFYYSAYYPVARSAEGALDCISIGESTVVVVGNFYVSALGLRGGRTAFYSSDMLRTAVTYDSKYTYGEDVPIYVGGSDTLKSPYVFRVDKFYVSRHPTKISLSFLGESYKSKGLPGYNSTVLSLDINAKTGHLWLVGVALNKDEEKWWIEVINKDTLTLIRTVDLNIPGSATGVTSDFEGNVYIVGSRGTIVKLNSEGRLIRKVEISNASLSKILSSNNALLVLGHEKIEDYYRHVLYVFDLDLNLIGKYVLSANVKANSYFLIGKAAIENNMLYVAGVNDKPGDLQLAIYSIALPAVIITTTTTTITETVTQTIIQTRTMTETTTQTQTTTKTMTQTTTETRTLTETKTMTQTLTQTLIETNTLFQTRTITETKTETVTRTHEIIPVMPLLVASIAFIALIALVAMLLIRR